MKAGTGRNSLNTSGRYVEYAIIQTLRKLTSREDGGLSPTFSRGRREVWHPVEERIPWNRRSFAQIVPNLVPWLAYSLPEDSFRTGAPSESGSREWYALYLYAPSQPLILCSSRARTQAAIQGRFLSIERQQLEHMPRLWVMSPSYARATNAYEIIR